MVKWWKWRQCITLCTDPIPVIKFSSIGKYFSELSTCQTFFSNLISFSTISGPKITIHSRFKIIRTEIHCLVKFQFDKRQQIFWFYNQDNYTNELTKMALKDCIPCIFIFILSFLFIPPANEVAGVYSDPYVRPFVRPSLPPSQSLIRYSSKTSEQNFIKLSGIVHYMMPYCTTF